MKMFTDEMPFLSFNLRVKASKGF